LSRFGGVGTAITGIRWYRVVWFFGLFRTGNKSGLTGDRTTTAAPRSEKGREEELYSTSIHPSPSWVDSCWVVVACSDIETPTEKVNNVAYLLDTAKEEDLGHGLQPAPLRLPGDPMSRSVFSLEPFLLPGDLAFEPTRGGNHGMAGPGCDTLECWP
jgi:hypothetical protein